jgi:pimeloyl-ACP methyl ester carboxylesterase
MISTVSYHGANLRYSELGKGNPVVLIHGYLESLEIWNGFAEKLAKKYRVISVDLPGHGQSGIYSSINTMAVMADAVKSIMDHLSIGRAVIIGHSMGGYVTLALADIFPEMIVGFCLFHSHALPDSEDKKLNRDRETLLVKEGKKSQFINLNIQNAFAPDHHESFSKQIDRAREIAEGTSDEGIIRALEGMKARPDRRDVLKNSVEPVMIIAGGKDFYIPSNVYEEHFTLARKTSVLVLENSGHMGFIEEQEKSLEGVLKFLDELYN